MSITISIASKQKPLVSRAFLSRMKDAVLGNSYELSVAFVESSEIKKLNRKFRNKNEPTDILSFPLSNKSGEIVLCMTEIAKQSPLFGRTTANFLRFLFIHGLLHLKGYEHGRKMDALEDMWRKKFKI